MSERSADLLTHRLRYVTTSTFGAAVGSEASGRIIHALQDRGWSLVDTYHVMFLSYAVMGTVNAVISFMLTDECELQQRKAYSQISQVESEQLEPPPRSDPDDPTLMPLARKSWAGRFWKNLSGRLSQISVSTRKVMYKLWLLLALDSLADGTYTELLLLERAGKV